MIAAGDVTFCLAAFGLCLAHVLAPPCVRDLTPWPLYHLLFHLVLGVRLPFRFAVWLLLSVAWELAEIQLATLGPAFAAVFGETCDDKVLDMAVNLAGFGIGSMAAEIHRQLHWPIGLDFQ